MRIIFRVDAALHIGTGHFQRCKTLAKALIRSGHNVHFFSREFGDGVACNVEELAISIHIIGNSTVDILRSKDDRLWLGVSQEEDAKNFIESVKRSQVFPDVVIVDHYSLDYEWEGKIKKALSPKVVVIDDLANRRHDCEVLLDQNYYVNFESRYQNLVSRNTKQLLGPMYVLLREEFLALRAIDSLPSINKVLVNFGGVGNMQVWEKFIPALQETSDLYFYHLITGKLPAHQYRQIHDALSESNIICEEVTNNMAHYMNESIFSIGACGSTVWERFCLGLNSCLIDIADNQIELVEALVQRGLIDYLGSLQDLSSGTIVSYLRNLSVESSVYTERERVIQKLVDGKGALRVVAEIESIVGEYV